MLLVRETIAKVFVVLAVVLGTVALGSWWSSLLVAKASGTITSALRDAATSAIETQLNRLSPGSGDLPAVRQAIDEALSDPSVTRSMAEGQGSQALRSKLASIDPDIAAVLGNASLGSFAGRGQRDLASAGRDLHRVATGAAIAAAALGGGALALSARRRRVLRHLGIAAGVVSALALVASWAVPDVIDHTTHGNVRHYASDIVSGGAPARGVLVGVLVAGALTVAAGVALEFVGGAKGAHSGGAPPVGRVV